MLGQVYNRDLERATDMVLLHPAKVSVWGGGRGAAVIQWCLAAMRLMKLNGGESMVGEQGEMVTREQLVHQVQFYSLCS